MKLKNTVEGNSYFDMATDLLLLANLGKNNIKPLEV